MSLVKREAVPLVATEDYSLGATTPAEQAYRDRYEQLFPRLCDFAARFLPRADAEDVVQDAMREIWRRWPVLTVDRTPSVPFFFRAVRNRIANKRRRVFREEQRLKRFLYRMARRSQRMSAPDARLEREELASIIEATVASLPERCKETWTLIRENELTYEQAGEAMDISPLTAKKHMTRAQAILREALTDAGYHEAALAQGAHARLLPAPAVEREQGEGEGHDD